MKKDAFFRKLGPLAVTYDDVDFEQYDLTLETGQSDVMPAEVSLRTRFSAHVTLNMPLVSAAQTTVTEHRLAIELALHGGIGIIHRDCSIEEQLREIGKVKHYLHGGPISNPKTVRPDETLEEVLNRITQQGWGYQSFPAVDDDRRLVGLLTRDSFKFCLDLRRKVADEMKRDIVTVSPDITDNEAFEIMLAKRIGALPVVDEARHLVSLYIFKDLKRTRDGTSVSNVDALGQLVVGAAIGVGDEEWERAQELARKLCNVLVLDTAHADSRRVYKMLERIKKGLAIDVVAGNVSVGASARRLAERGADGVKVGQGPGSICTTRLVAGIGIPQITAVWNCARAVRRFNIPVCADGGIRYPGDVTKAIVAGADSVMMGGEFAGTDESPGEVFTLDGQQWKLNRGMGSLGAMRESKGSRERYRQGDDDELVPEGIEGRVSYKGSAHKVIVQFTGGLRAGMGYIGAHTIRELQKKGIFVLVTQSGRTESHPHDITITKDAPNYRVNKYL